MNYNINFITKFSNQIVITLTKNLIRIVLICAKEIFMIYDSYLIF